MRKFILALRFEALLLPSLSQNHHSNPSKSLLPLISFTFSQKRACSSTVDLNAESSVLGEYLINSLKFSEARALAVSSRFSYIKSLEKPEKVVLFFKALGLSDAQIQSIAHCLPTLLFANVEKTVKPKVIFFQEELGLSGPRLSAIISKSPYMLKQSLDRTLKPCIGLIKKVVKSDGRSRSNEKVNDDLFRILKNWNGFVVRISRLEANISYLESCGVVGSQLSSLLLTRIRIFVMHEERLSGLVSRALDMDFTMGSRMLVHALRCLSDTSIETLNGKFEVFIMSGFSKDEPASMLRKSPLIFGLSKATLRRKLEFFLDIIKINKSVLVQHPVLLSYSIEERVIPRYKVLHILDSMRVLSKDSNYYQAMCLSNRQFLEKCIFRFKNDAEQLLLAYNGLSLYVTSYDY